MALFGGLAAKPASAASPRLQGRTACPCSGPGPGRPRKPETLDPETAASLDKTDAEFSQYYYYRRPVYRRRVYYRPVVSPAGFIITAARGAPTSPLLVIRAA